uniref:Aldehyde dehydrogenase n=1 Tax=Arion vulgaris TaxID=1028688 RepID=A0A0B7BWN9_9EUPU
MAEYGETMKDLRASFATGKTRTYEWRAAQLKAVLKLVHENEDKIAEVLTKDLHKSRIESEIMETILCVNDAVDMINNVQDWMKGQKVSKSSIYIMDTAYVVKEPLGVVLVIGAWNYPIQLVLLPLIGAIAAGNCVVIKPSEVSEASAKFFEEVVPKYLDKDCFRVVNGGVPETTALLKERFDLIFYTGNSFVGKIVMKAAAEYLTPVVLELGGKSPVYVDKDTNLTVVARRLTWGKFCNAGQTCIAPDYVMCAPELQDELVSKIKLVIDEFYTTDPKQSESYGRIVNDKHYQRLQKLKEEGSVIAIGGEDDEKDKYIAPTVIKDVKFTDKVMQEEIFGPILPIIPIKDHQEAIEIINNREKPLAIYVFTNNKTVVQDFKTRTSSGGLLINDTVVHAGLTSLPFGGVGNSGIGSYHGKYSFDAFSHSKPVLEKSLAIDQVNNVRYPPYTENKRGWINWIMRKKVKRTGFFSFFPFVVMGAMFAMVFKTVGVTAEGILGNDDRA